MPQLVGRARGPVYDEAGAPVAFSLAEIPGEDAGLTVTLSQTSTSPGLAPMTCAITWSWCVLVSSGVHVMSY